MKANEKELRDEIQKSKKLKDSALLNEGFGIKDYVKSLSLQESRTFFKHRCKVTQYVKMNFRNDRNFSKKLWKCDFCQNMDTESHLLWCKQFSHLRENKDLHSNKDLCNYLHEIMKIRESEKSKKPID